MNIKLNNNFLKFILSNVLMILMVCSVYTASISGLSILSEDTSDKALPKCFNSLLDSVFSRVFDFMRCIIESVILKNKNQLRL